MLVDIHAHLFKMSKEALDKSLKSKMMILNAGLDIKTNKRVLELSGKGLYRAIGGHPSEAEKLDVEEVISQLEENKKEFRAVGEIGLDKHYKVDFRKQLKLFEAFLEFASKNKYPVVVHSRKAEKEVLDVLENYDLRILLHSFGGRKKLVKIGAERRYYFGVPSIVFKSSHYQMIVNEVDIKYLITETDSPWQPPVVGEENTPMTVSESIKKINEMKSIENAEKVVETNFKKFLSI